MAILRKSNPTWGSPAPLSPDTSISLHIMFGGSSRRLLACTCAASQRAAFMSTSSARSSSATPWFVDSPPAASDGGSHGSSTTSQPRMATAPEPTAPPPHLPPPLHKLHSHLSVSPFLDKSSLTYINAREADPDSTWVDWVVVSTLKAGRERGIRGAIESVRAFVS